MEKKKECKNKSKNGIYFLLCCNDVVSEQINRIMLHKRSCGFFFACVCARVRVYIQYSSEESL